MDDDLVFSPRKRKQIRRALVSIRISLEKAYVLSTIN